MNMLRRFSIRLYLITVFIFCIQRVFATADQTDTLDLLQQVQSVSKYSRLDSLKRELDAIIDDSVKAPVYTQIAAEYLTYNATSDRRHWRAYQNAAISNTLSAIHYFSKYDDSIGLRKSFDMLANIYHAQHKYPQAKWFILQSNKISRKKIDTINIIASLIELSAIKTDIKDYKLAMKDLDEAFSLAINRYPALQSEVQLHYAMLYNVMKNYKKEAVALKRHKAIDDRLKRAEARSTAQLATRDSLQQQKKLLNKQQVAPCNKNGLVKTIILHHHAD
jgi:hypothetical protein